MTINYGPETGKLAVIVEVIDQSRVLLFCNRRGRSSMVDCEIGFD